MRWNRNWDRLGGVLSGVSVFVGMLVLIGFLTRLVTSLTVPNTSGRSVVFTKDGEPRIEQYDYDEFGGQITEWLDLHRQSVARYTDREDVPSLGVASVASYRDPWTSGFVSPLGASYRNDPRRSMTFWYLLPHEGIIEGFIHPEASRLVAYGPEGRISDELDARFTSPFQAWTTKWGGATKPAYPFEHLLADGETVYGFATYPPHMFEIWRTGDGAVDGLGIVRRYRKPIEAGQVFVRAKDRLTVLDTDGNVLGAMHLPKPFQKLDYIYPVGFTGERIILSRSMGTNRTLVYSFSPDGELLNEWDITLSDSQPLVWWQSQIPLSFCLSASPCVSSAFLLGTQYWDPYNSIPLPSPYWPLLTLSAAITLVFVLLTWRHLRYRASRGQAIGWIVLVALLSWPGFLVCICTVRVSRRIGCPACNRPRSPEQETCPLCQGSWPAPEPTGLEILRPATT